MKVDGTAILLYDKEKRVLLQHRDEGLERMPGYWGFFGGALRDGEAPEDGIRRETMEELEYELSEPRLVMTYDYNDRDEGDMWGRMYVFVEEYDPSKKIVLNEGQGMRWTDFSEVKDLKMIGYAKEILHKVEGNI